LDETYKRAKNNIKFVSDIDTLNECSIVYISQDVATDDLGQSELIGIESLINLASQNIQEKTRLVILCQVPPGFTRKMEKYHKNISYQVETLVFGEAIDRAQNPERIILGLQDKEIPIDSDYRSILEEFNCPIICLNFESAEFTKIAINAYLAASIITTNALNNLANFVGGEWDSIKKSLQLDKRIGEFAYLKPGLGISGGNIERDLKTLDKISQEILPKEENLFHTFLKLSNKQKTWILDAIHDQLILNKSNVKIGILGIAYKENTASTKNSPALLVANKFQSSIVGYYDPMATFPDDCSEINIFKSSVECIQESDLIVVATPWPEFASLNFTEILKNKSTDVTFIDPYGVINTKKMDRNIKVIKMVKS
jgi:UDPglucose 6-dehydrogenase